MRFSKIVSDTVRVSNNTWTGTSINHQQQNTFLYKLTNKMLIRRTSTCEIGYLSFTTKVTTKSKIPFSVNNINNRSQETFRLVLKLWIQCDISVCVSVNHVCATNQELNLILVSWFFVCILKSLLVC